MDNTNNSFPTGDVQAPQTNMGADLQNSVDPSQITSNLQAGSDVSNQGIVQNNNELPTPPIPTVVTEPLPVVQEPQQVATTQIIDNVVPAPAVVPQTPVESGLSSVATVSTPIEVPAQVTQSIPTNSIVQNPEAVSSVASVQTTDNKYRAPLTSQPSQTGKLVKKRFKLSFKPNFPKIKEFFTKKLFTFRNLKFFGIGLGSITLALGLYFLIYSITNQPMKVRVTNETGSSATVSWVTSRPDKGFVVYGTENKFGWGPFAFFSKNKAYDDRDVALAESDYVTKINKAALKNVDGDFNVSIDQKTFDETKVKVSKVGNYYVHHVTIQNLESNKKYYFTVGNGVRTWTVGQSNQKVSEYDFPVMAEFAFSTYDHPKSIPTPDPAYGRVYGMVKKNGFLTESNSKDSIVFAYLITSEGTGTQVLSSVTNKDGGWVLDKANFRDLSGNLLKSIKNGTDKLVITAQYENLLIKEKRTVTVGDEDSPMRPILGNVEGEVIAKGLNLGSVSKLFASINTLGTNSGLIKKTYACYVYPVSWDCPNGSSCGSSPGQCNSHTTTAPTSAPTKAPTTAPTKAPTTAPTKAPTTAPTKAPTTAPNECEHRGSKCPNGAYAPDGCLDDCPATPTKTPTAVPTPTPPSPQTPNCSDFGRTWYCSGTCGHRYVGDCGDSTTPTKTPTVTPTTARACNPSYEKSCGVGWCCGFSQNCGTKSGECITPTITPTTTTTVTATPSKVTPSNISPETGRPYCDTSAVPRSCNADDGQSDNGCYTAGSNGSYTKCTLKPGQDCRPAGCANPGRGECDPKITDHCEPITNPATGKLCPGGICDTETSCKSKGLKYDSTLGVCGGKLDPDPKATVTPTAAPTTSPSNCATGYICKDGKLTGECDTAKGYVKSYASGGEAFCTADPSLTCTPALGCKNCKDRDSTTACTNKKKQYCEGCEDLSCLNKYSCSGISLQNSKICADKTTVLYIGLDKDGKYSASCVKKPTTSLAGKICCYDSVNGKFDIKDPGGCADANRRSENFCLSGSQGVCCKDSSGKTDWYTAFSCETVGKSSGGSYSQVDLDSGSCKAANDSKACCEWNGTKYWEPKKDCGDVFGGGGKILEGLDEKACIGTSSTEMGCCTYDATGSKDYMSRGQCKSTNGAFNPGAESSCGYCCQNAKNSLGKSYLGWSMAKCSYKTVDKPKSECSGEVSSQSIEIFSPVKKAYAESSSSYSVDDSDSSIIYFPESGSYSFEVNGKKYNVIASDNQSTTFFLDRNGVAGYQAPADVKNPKDNEDLIINFAGSKIAINKESKNFKIDLKKGVNLVSFPFMPAKSKDSPLTAMDLMKMSNLGSLKIVAISQFKNGKWDGGVHSKSSDNTVDSGNDFPLTFGIGYLIIAESNATIDVPGLAIQQSIPVAFSAGWNLVGINGYSQTFTANSLLDSISGTPGLTADNVTWWPTSKGKYEGLQKSEGTTYGFDYPIQNNLGYFVRISKFAPTDTAAKSIIWNPGGELHGKSGSSK